MEKIKLPIKESQEDNINPLNPDFLWLWKMLWIIALIIIALFFIIYFFFVYI